MKFINNTIFFKISIIFVIFILDQISKAYVINLFNEVQFNEIYLLKFINIYLIWNEGIAFGLLNFDNEVIYNIITYLIIFISLVVLYFAFKNLDYRPSDFQRLEHQIDLRSSKSNLDASKIYD